MTQTPYLIKKYANRRLYDFQTKRFLKLEEIRDLIRAGHRVQVEDADGKDATRQVLLQVIADCEDQGPALLSAETLHVLAGFYGDVMQGVFGQYLDESVRTFLRQQQGWRRTMEAAFEQGPVAAFEQLAKAQMGLLFNKPVASQEKEPPSKVKPRKRTR